MAEAVSGILPREDKATAMCVLSLSGRPRLLRGRGRPFYADLEGFRLASYRPGRFVREAAMTNAGSLAGMWCCISQHVFAIVMARSGQAAFRVAAHGAVEAEPQGSRERRWNRGPPEVMRLEKKARDGGMFVG
jgi:hypothetical protein